jgi:4-amino-4-deoxy-L-arabinose transferase-like glycosyltransferase
LSASPSLRSAPASTRLAIHEQTIAWALFTIAVVAYAVLAVGYALRTPIWQNPDEPAHFNYIAQLAETATLPELRQGDWDSALLDRLKNGQLTPGDDIRTIRYESWQPPLYYLLAAPAYRLGAADVWQTVLRLRLFSVVLGGITLAIAFAAAREVFPLALAATVPLVMAGVPMFTAVSASISDDALSNLLAALLLALLIKRRPSPRMAFGVGAILGLALITKLGLAIFVPLVVFVFGWRALIATVVVVSPWLVHQVTTYGWLDPLAIARHNMVVADQPRFPGLSAGYATQFAQVSFHSFWAQFGWMAIPAPDRLYWLWGALLLIAVGGLAWQRDWLDEARWRLIGITLALALLAYVGYNLSFQQFQGRYLFTALVPFALLCVLGWTAWVPTRLGFAAAGIGGAALVVLNAYALTRVLAPGFGTS